MLSIQKAFKSNWILEIGNPGSQALPGDADQEALPPAFLRHTTRQNGDFWFPGSAWGRRSGGSASRFPPPHDEAEPLDIGSQAEPRNQLN